ncbi:MAG: glycosyltransferase [Chitinophagaceae bacterium]|jgi:glycosyltransferase involved in cell wall biosynthesis
MPTRILFLAAHLQPFLAAGIRSLMTDNDVEIIIYCEKRDENRLIDIQPNSQLRIFTYDYEPETFFWKTIDAFKPDIVVCAGWMFWIYTSWSKALRRNGAKTICTMDNQWKGSLKQKLLVLLSPFTIKSAFTHAWVPGKRQEDYAIRLGFAAGKILHHLYAPDTLLFDKAYQDFIKSELKLFPKRFLYVGRLEDHKVKNLLLAFRSLTEAERGAWVLNIIGNGSLENSSLLQHPSIVYSGSLPQQQLVKLAAQNGVFCLCSADEPWGTVVQEFSAAGLPLLISKQCGSSDHFLSDNGFLCDGKDVQSIKSCLINCIKTSDTDLFQMSKSSHQLGMCSNSVTWANELMRLV